jgi:predicted nucleic acid-binding protein
MNIICDTSIIINFLKINRLDLLAEYSHKFWVTDHVDREITNDYPAQQQLFQRAFDKLAIQKTSVEDPQELDLFIELIKNGQLGSGECATIAVAVNRGYFLAIDDNQAIKKAELLMAPTKILRTQDILVRMIRENLLSIESADQLLQNWATYHRFKLKIPTIKDLFSENNLLQEASFQWGVFPLVLKFV